MSERERCEGCEEDECLRCLDMVLAGLRQSDDFDAEIRRVHRHGADPMDLLYSTQVSTDQDGLVGTDDIGGLSAAWRLP